MWPGACFWRVPRRFRAPHILKSWSFYMFPIQCKRKEENSEVWWLRTSALRRYKENCGTPKRPENFGTFEKQTPGPDRSLDSSNVLHNALPAELSSNLRFCLFEKGSVRLRVHTLNSRSTITTDKLFIYFKGYKLLSIGDQGSVRFCSMITTKVTSAYVVLFGSHWATLFCY